MCICDLRQTVLHYSSEEEIKRQLETPGAVTTERKFEIQGGSKPNQRGASRLSNESPKLSMCWSMCPTFNKSSLTYRTTGQAYTTISFTPTLESEFQCPESRHLKDYGTRAIIQIRRSRPKGSVVQTRGHCHCVTPCSTVNIQ